MEEIFESVIRTAGDIAGVFEFDGDTGYFYLYQLDEAQDHRILDSIHILSGTPDFSELDITIGWDSKEEKVGLFIRGKLWAVYDVAHSSKYGGDYDPEATPGLPSWIVEEFAAL